MINKQQKWLKRKRLRSYNSSRKVNRVWTKANYVKEKCVFLFQLLYK